jgi:hypothetical protein
MATIHEQRLAVIVEQILDAEPTMGGMLLTMQRRLKSGFYAEPGIRTHLLKSPLI